MSANDLVPAKQSRLERLLQLLSWLIGNAVPLFVGTQIFWSKRQSSRFDVAYWLIALRVGGAAQEL